MRTVEVGEFAAKTRNLNPSHFTEEEFDLLSIPAFDRGLPEIVCGGAIGSSKQLVYPGDVMISKIVPHIRRVWIVPANEGRRQIASGEWIVFRNSEFLSPWLRHLLMSEGFHQAFLRTVAGVGGSLLRARPAHVFKIRVQVPDTSKQRRIAEILDKADFLRAKRSEAITHLHTLSQSIFHEMFGLPSQNNLGWPIMTIGDLLTSTQYGTSEKSEQAGSVPVLRMGNLTYEGHLNLTDLKYLAEGSDDAGKYVLNRGDVLFNRTNSPDLVGKTALFDEVDPYSFAGYLIRLRCGADLDPQYLTSFMNAPDTKTKLRSMCKSIVGMANINAKEVQAMSIMLPPLELQRDFARRIEAIERLKSKHRTQLVELDNLFLSLQDRAFMGEL